MTRTTRRPPVEDLQPVTTRPARASPHVDREDEDESPTSTNGTKIGEEEPERVRVPATRLGGGPAGPLVRLAARGREDRVGARVERARDVAGLQERGAMISASIRWARASGIAPSRP